MYGPGVRVGNWLETALSEEVSISYPYLGPNYNQLFYCI